jgi:hypothetical protein
MKKKSIALFLFCTTCFCIKGYTQASVKNKTQQTQARTTMAAKPELQTMERLQFKENVQTTEPARKLQVTTTEQPTTKQALPSTECATCPKLKTTSNETTQPLINNLNNKD